VIERCFGVLKMKWRILLNMPSYPMEKQSKIIIACMALHNFIRDSAIHDAHFDNYDGEAAEVDQHAPDVGNGPTDDADMGALRDFIANGLVQ
jgi:hypothetical protein